MIIHDNTKYELNLYTDETCNTLKAIIHRSVDKENTKKEIKYIKEHDPDVMKRLKLVKIHTIFDTVDIDKFMEGE